MKTKKKLIRAKSAEFVKALVEKSKQKEEPAKPDYGEKDMEKVKKITQELKDQHAIKKGIRSTKSN